MRVLRLPIKLFLSMELEPFHCAYRVMHELNCADIFTLRRCRMPNNKQKKHAQQLTAGRDFDDL